MELQAVLLVQLTAAAAAVQTVHAVMLAVQAGAVAVTQGRAVQAFQVKATLEARLVELVAVAVAQVERAAQVAVQLAVLAVRRARIVTRVQAFRIQAAAAVGRLLAARLAQTLAQAVQVVAVQTAQPIEQGAAAVQQAEALAAATAVAVKLLSDT
jgi:hypothetical protein